MNTDILWSLAPQGSEEWLEARRGVVTGSIAAIARDKLKSGAPSKACILKARNLARERVGGRPEDVFTNAAMRLGTAEEPKAREAYEDRTGFMVEEVGFAYTEDGRFGCSVDGIVHMPAPSPRPWLWECKTIVSSDRLFEAVIGGDVSEWIDQCTFNTWLLTAAGIRLYLHVWDLPELSREFVLPRDEAAIEALERDMVDFERLVAANERALLAAMGRIERVEAEPADNGPPWAVEPSEPAPMAAPPAPAVTRTSTPTAPAQLAPAF